MSKEKDRVPEEIPKEQEVNNNNTDDPILSGKPIAEAEQLSINNPFQTDVHPDGYQPSTSEDMEVHHHAHHAHGKKTWKHYFWEFLMLFLAVFCGFLAEYQLEHKIEKDREKVYMQNMLEDLEADIAVYSDYTKRNAVIYDLIDTLVYLIKSPDRNKHISKLTYTARIMTAKWREVNPVKRTYEQMKSSGHLRLIGKRQVADSVSSYYNSLFELDTYNRVGMIWAADYAKAIGKIFDGGDLLKIIKEKREQPLTTKALLTEDKLVINELLTSAGYFYGALSLNENLGTNRSKAAQRLIELIRKEYRL
jgi:hypothetical protein